MNTYHPYNNDWNDPYDRPVPGYIFQNPAPAPAAPSSFGRSAAIAAVLVGTIGAGAVLGWALFGHTNTSAAATRPATIELPGPVPGTPQAPGAPAPVIVEQGPAQVIPVPDSGSNAPVVVLAPDNAPTPTGNSASTNPGNPASTDPGNPGIPFSINPNGLCAGQLCVNLPNPFGQQQGGGTNGGDSGSGGGNTGSGGGCAKGHGTWDSITKSCINDGGSNGGGNGGGGNGGGGKGGPGMQAWCVTKGGKWDPASKTCK